MKKMRFLLMATAGFLAFTSCDDNDDNNSENLLDDLTGTYELTRLLAPIAQDFDNDGDTSTNLVTEGSCYNSSWISLHADGTYDQEFSWTTVSENGATLDCDVMMTSGTYVQDGNNVTTTQTSGGVDLSTTFVFDAQNHTLSTTDQDGSYAGFDNDSSLFAELTGNLELTFTKYTENENDNGAGQNDDDNVDGSGLAEAVGSFDLESFLVATAQDLNNDGNSNTNLVSETNCYGNSNLTLNADGTYEQSWSQSVLATGATSLECETETQTGFWTRQGDVIYLNRLSGSSVVTTSLTLDTSANAMTQSQVLQFPTYNSALSLFAIQTGTVNLTYDKTAD